MGKTLAAIALGMAFTGCAAGMNGEGAARLCSGAKVEFKSYGFRVTSGDSEFLHIESYPALSMEVPGGCNNILNQRGDNEIYIRTYEDNKCDGSVDLFYQEFRRNRQEPIVQRPAGSVEATRYYSEFFDMDVPKAEELWREWKQKGGN